MGEASSRATPSQQARVAFPDCKASTYITHLVGEIGGPGTPGERGGAVFRSPTSFFF